MHALQGALQSQPADAISTKSAGAFLQPGARVPEAFALWLTAACCPTNAEQDKTCPSLLAFHDICMCCSLPDSDSAIACSIQYWMTSVSQILMSPVPDCSRAALLLGFAR